MELRLFLGEFFDAICVTDCGEATAVAQSTASQARVISAQLLPSHAPLQPEIQACNSSTGPARVSGRNSSTSSSPRACQPEWPHLMFPSLSNSRPAILAASPSPCARSSSPRESRAGFPVNSSRSLSLCLREISPNMSFGPTPTTQILAGNHCPYSQLIVECIPANSQSFEADFVG
ncbi:hypothetical protein TIFTF001_017019 [Ficus carica]|uniref:Uncharacterized protein n=1 Tax=Ficus carica TaxID=3494 RepID=A0AA88ABE9_FICCA|nr:hypothetical protein TIFTF001_017019 [Ficus carica]